MYEQALSMMEEPAYIKAHLPLAYVAEKAGIQLVAGEGRLHGICPFHPDTDPSFDIYPWGEGERFGCFACGAGGDVIDFIQRMWCLSFREACEMAKRGITKLQEEGWKAPALTGRFEWDEAAAVDLLRRASTEGVEQIIEAKGWPFPASHIVGTWSVRAMGGQLLVPLWDEHRHLVGMKHRPLNGTRSLISLPGSRLRSTLYGAGREEEVHEHVLLCEGESDAWTASWALAGSGIEVLALPAGAGAAPTRLDLLVGRQVLICFDGDDAGRMSAARWAEALPNTRTISLPDGDDITSMEVRHPGWLASKFK